MTTTEMVYVLDKMKECVQRRTVNDCIHDCRHCEAYMEPSNMLDAIERIVNYIFHVDKSNTRKSF